jgi:DHA1 family tetracycline resistance protein-like MFS transporter
VQGGLVGRVSAALGPVRALRTGLVVTAAGLALLAAATRWVVLVPALALLALGQGIASPTLTALVANRARDDRRGEALGVQQSATALARIVGPAAAGALFQHAGVPWPYLIGAGLVAVALAVAIGGAHDVDNGSAPEARSGEGPAAAGDMHPSGAATAAE